MNEIEELVFDNIPIFEEEKEDNIDEELDFLLEDEFNNFDSNSSTLNEVEEDEISEEDAEDLVTSEDNKKKKSNNSSEENTQEEVSNETNEEQPTEADATDLVDSNNESTTEENINNTQEEETPSTENNEEDNSGAENSEDEETDGNETQEEGSTEGEEEPSEEDLANAEEKAKEDKDRYSYYQLFEEMYDNIKLLVDKTKDIIERTNNNTNEKGILRTILDEIYVIKEDIEYLLIEKINSMEIKNINILYITFSSKVMLLLDLIQKITSNKES